MYTKQEVSKLKQAFWTSFGKYMKPILSADGDVISWSNYKTGISGISFKMDADNRNASIAIVISPADPALHKEFYNQFLLHKGMLAAALGEDDWQWEADTTDEYGRDISKISKQLDNISVLRSEDWPDIISFFKPRILALDEFWSMARYAFEAVM
ncbi:DUF4268 domain-containing protein [Chitinophaga pinensis]|uniref:DUF4268 domain-containing protein n=1 Tax=Chitinophaga pinensis (strain ATCC 43595 / DSM 2588 / LMG 13176 / NBRC 15968 / NCIMB 11800 / UQM 2034) TaxID=485918 RepID=A0A979G984_CHIPD|nr:DUF4268 domain-containing protein [Chitinophaga pinensis]ACU63040.1 hypothetical protein Cpin_5614 [Chitinophaga pinensis DSM 2588]